MCRRVSSLDFKKLVRLVCCRKGIWSLLWLERREFGPLEGSGFPNMAFQPLFLVVWGYA